MKKTLLFLVITCQMLFAQNDKIATIGNFSISIDEFTERYELSPVIGKLNLVNDEGAKYSLLHSMIGEKLWAYEALKHQIDTMASVKIPVGIIEKMYVRDALYKKEILSKINISNEDLQSALEKYLKKLKLRFIYSDNEKDITSKYYLLKNGYSFDSLYKANVKIDNTREIGFGDFEEATENEVYKLKIGESTKPLFLKEGWYIFNLVTATNQVFADFQGKNNTIEKIKEIIADRKAEVIVGEYYSTLFKNVKAKSERRVLELVAVEIEKLIKDKKAEKDTNGYYFKLTYDEAEYLKSALAQELQSKFIEINENKYTLAQFLDELAFFGFRVEQKDLKTIKNKINQKAKTFIEYEVFATEGYKQGLNLLPEVVNQVNMWRDNYLFQVYRNKFLFDKYKAIKDSLVAIKGNVGSITKDYTIVEVKFDNLNIAQTIFDELTYMNINDFKTKYLNDNSVSVECKIINSSNDVNFEYVGVLSNMGIGELYGPNKKEDIYTIVKLTDVKIDTSDITSKEDSAIDEYAKDKAGELVRDETANLAKKYGFNIDKELLKSVKTTTINAYIVKMFGFGGRIGAVPLLPPFYNWIETYKKLINQDL